MPNAWLVLAAGDDRQHGGNDGYDDDPASTYRWDNTVPNHGAIAVGDAVVLWDKRSLIGASVVEEIVEDDEVKNVYRCSNCGRAHIKRRKHKQPQWRCFECSTNFETPVVEQREVHTYASRHDVGWVDLGGVLTGAQLRQLCVSPKSQLSLRALKWPAFKAAVEAALPGTPLTVLEFRGERVIGGHTKATVRVRRGQGAFRNKLVLRYGPKCAITGLAPLATLEAGHLYSYASVGEHDDHGGLLLRRDIHRLFDLGQIAVNPKTLKIDAQEDLLRYPQYAAIHDASLTVDVTAGQRKWLRAHWVEHRSSN